MRPYSYLAYGLEITSNVVIPGFSRNTEPSAFQDLSLNVSSDLPPWFLASERIAPVVHYSQPAVPGVDSPAYSLTAWGADRLFEFAYSDGGRFAIDAEARRVWAQCPPLGIDDVGVYLRGPIMGFVLRRRGVTALHASAVAIAGKSVVLCGPSESGKSTTAAALALRGVPVLSDDITALRELNGTYYTESGYPRVCLWPDAAENLLGSADSLPRLTPTWEKRFLPLDGSQATFEANRLPIAAVYLLAPRDAEAHAPRIEEISVRQALLELVQNTYMNWLLDRERRAAEFDVLTKLLMEVPVRRIVPHADHHRIGELCELIRHDAGQIAQARPRTRALAS